jgi:hypothetical protein
MTTDSFYWYASVLIFVPWFMLIFLPNGKYTDRTAIGCAVILLLGATYFTIQYLFGGSENDAFSSLEGTKNLFRSKDMLLTGWLNYLSFCLLGGVWLSDDAHKNKIPHILAAPCLALTMLLGPSGMLIYLLMRFTKTGKWSG